MDIGEGGGGDGGGGEERDADISAQALSLPLVTSPLIPEQGSASRTSARTLAKEPPTLREKQEEEGTEGSRGGGEAQVGGKENGHSQKDGACQKRWMKGNLQEGPVSGRNEVDTGLKPDTEGLPNAHNNSSNGGEEEEEEEEEAISNQSQTKSKCSLLPQQSQQSAFSSTAKASGTLNSKTAASLKSSQTSSTSPRNSPFLSTSPKHFTCPPYSSSVPLSERDDINGDQDWISVFPQSFNSQQSTPAFPLAGMEEASAPAEEDGPAGVPYSSISNGDGAKAPQPNDSQLETDMDDDRDNEGEQKEAVPKNLNQELSPNSLTSQMTAMHSRNSCKTLKCPKCNWHYKSQHTLQVHMKEKHPETGGQCVCAASGGKCVCGSTTRGVCGYCSSGKPHPRLARGETYACGYKPYRCEVCDYATSSKGNLSIHMQSDKHLNNVQNGGQSNGQINTSHISNNSSSSNGTVMDDQAYKLPLTIPTPATQPAKLTPPAHSPSNGKRWRCDVCDYETSIARNLRIHTTSEKHTHNMLRLQRGYYLSHCRSLAPHLKHLQSTGGELLNMRLSHQVAEQPVTLGSTLTPSPSPSPSPPPVACLSPTGPLSQGVLQCLVCSCFTTDSIESMEHHLNTPRSLPQSEWCSLIAGGCHCRLCGYTTPLRANFSLHCQTDRHRTRYQLAAHLQEGGDRGQEGAALLAKGNPIQLRCNLCEFVTSSLEKLQGHSQTSNHKSSVRVYRFLQQYDGEVDGGSWLFHCLLCNHSSSSKLEVLKHSQTQTHQQREGLLQLQPMGGEELAAIFTIRKIPEEVTGELNEDMENSTEVTTGPLDQTKDNLGVKQMDMETDKMVEETDKVESHSVKRQASGCGEVENSIVSKRPRKHQQSENPQTVQCPLCQVKIPYTHLRPHLTHVHSVAQDCVDKLISTVTPSLELLQLENELPSNLYTDDTVKNENITDDKKEHSDTTDSFTPDDSPKNKSISGENPEENLAAPKDVTALLTPPLEDNATHPSNGRLAPQSLTHTPPSSPTADPPSLSDRHGYRFRCSRCSLAFPTQEKLQLHWQYHAMRAATECPICSRQCRSQEALQRHMQNTHLQQDSTQNTGSLPHSVQYIEHYKSESVQQNMSLSPQDGQEAAEAEEEEREEEMEDENDILETGGNEYKEEFKTKEKDRIGETCEGDLIQLEKVTTDEIPLEPSFSSPIKKSSNPTLDRYLDPSRPYKCTVCSESFTQKTILLVHYNSVSHLHRARRALQESNTGVSSPETTRGQDPRPYRCKLCGVGYSQSSTLDIHLRSVLHQTRARAAQNPGPQISVSNVAASVPSTPTTTLAKETSKNLPFTKKPDVASSSTGVVAEAQLTASTDGQQAKKRVAELIASRNQLLLMQQQQLAQAQAQAQLQHTALLQAQMMQHLPIGPENLLQHFSLTPDNMLSLQQQLLLPFYFPGDMKLNPELATKTLEHTKAEAAKSTVREHTKVEAKKEVNPQTEEKTSQSQSSISDDIPIENMDFNTRVENGCNGSSNSPEEKECVRLEEKKEEMSVSVVKNDGQTQEKDSTSVNLPGLQCPPPRVPYAAVNGEALRALLQSYGYELALQYIQSRHRNQHHIASQMIHLKRECANISKMELYSVEQKQAAIKSQDNTSEVKDLQSFTRDNNGVDELGNKKKACCGSGEKCRDCGKFFSDAMILKSHQEYIHRLLLPTAALERFSKEYRLQYDQLYPLKKEISEEDVSTSTQVAFPATSSDSELVSEQDQPQIKTSPQPSLSDSDTKRCATPEDLTTASPPSPSLSFSQPQILPPKESTLTSTSSTVTSENTKAMPIPLPNIPMIPLPMPQLPITQLSLPKLPLHQIPFPMDLPLIPVMQALQPQTWLESSINPELAKIYQPQLNPVPHGKQGPINPAIVSQPSQFSPSLLGQPHQVNTGLLGQSAQTSSIQTGQQPQVSPTLIEQQQGKRTRTRISEDQLTILRKHFDINSLPSDDEINKISSLSSLPHKVIKHWFRNTLFKERQRDKDSPYNFNNPPTIALEENREEVLQNQSLTLSQSSPSPKLQDMPQSIDIQRGETHRGRRSSRTRFTENQLETLQRVFEATPYPREEEYDRLSSLLSLPNRVIVVWFQNARQRARKSQDREADDGIEGPSQLDILRQRDRCYRNDNDDNSCGDEQQTDSHNENSMDLTYEYYSQPDSPAFDSSSASHLESERSLGKDETTPTLKKQGNKTPTSETNKNVEKQITDVNIQPKEKVQASQTMSTPQAENLVQDQPENSADKSEPHASSPTQNTVNSRHSMSDSGQERIHSSSLNPAIEKPADTTPSKPSLSELEVTRHPEAPSRQSTETQSLNQIPPPNQFQCSVCPMSLPSFQMWQEHQTRHLLAAQSQVQLLHSGFPDRTMPYMMLHSNHSLMANQLLSGAMTQLHSNATNSMISHLNSTQVKNSFSDLSQSSFTSLKQNSKLMSEANYDIQRCGRESEEEHRRDKRQRTTITPEQLEILYQRYSLDSNPTRGVLEGIAQDVGLARRVVQVWFQNTRARERKGQFRSMGPGSTFSLGLNHLRCPFCRALFKVKSALDAHIRSRHWAEAERAGYNLSISNGSSMPIGMAMSSVMDKPGPSVSCNLVPNMGIAINNKEQTVKQPVIISSSSNDLINPGEYGDFEEDDEFQYDEGLNIADEASPSSVGSGGPSPDWGETLQPHHHQQQRQRTQMSHFQVLQLRDFYKNHRTPNRYECEALGQELGLPHRVVQVWFQNARAKEKRARSISSDSAEREQAELTAGAGERDRA
ncbi:zinc finger homeobox protein 3-like isoform X2 [Nerophis ophidion]|uniref:zinc finger homeobox protein 3-like isoform X2 n=1 Tax=Nerophis ophidion TaxID=159077 RepID=UPI002ADFA17E|nr:zinc finger homeobox protein 3-like isoform X2 [Nerophis ophidion]